jgi:hypothetical protein
MTEGSVPELREALELVASIEAQCEDRRGSGAGQEVLAEIEALLAEIRHEISNIIH